MIRVVSNELLLKEVVSAVRDGKPVVIRPKGNSMLPFIRGDRDQVLLVHPDDVRKYDVVLAQVREGVFVLHRVMEVRADSVVLMGDGNIKGREVCRMENVVAKMVEVIRDDRRQDCLSPRYRRKVVIWVRLLPLRRLILAVYKRIFI